MKCLLTFHNVLLNVMEFSMNLLCGSGDMSLETVCSGDVFSDDESWVDVSWGDVSLGGVSWGGRLFTGILYVFSVYTSTSVSSCSGPDMCNGESLSDIKNIISVTIHNLQLGGGVKMFRFLAVKNVCILSCKKSHQHP